MQASFIFVEMILIGDRVDGGRVALLAGATLREQTCKVTIFALYTIYTGSSWQAGWQV
jgi:hypothetical protein